MVRILSVIIIALFPAFVAADPPPPRSAGTKGTVTAWDESSTRVIEHRFCVRTRYSWDYARCGSRLRDDVKRQLCLERGAGVHRFLYQVGDARPTASTVLCRKP